MVKSSIKEIHDTIKTMLSYALALTENQIPTVYELGHYLADNILTKICLAVVIDKKEKQQTYTSRGWTKSLPNLYNDHMKKHYPQVPDYSIEVKQFHEERNVYQHGIESFDMTMRQPRAKSYVDLVERIMRIVGIIKSGETIQPKSLTSSIGGYDYSNIQTRVKETKFQKLHDLFKVQDDDDILIKIKNQLDFTIIHQLKNILSMQSSPPHRSHILMHNSKFNISLLSVYSGYQLSITREGPNKASYSPKKPTKNRDVLDDFLQYYRECCENVGMEIKP